ncbi:MAG: gamma-glutamyl-gamma-aminobutyrate hydrolase family protein [Actinomycetes bacterium]
MARRRIAITQRVVTSRDERRDALDQRWTSLADRLDALVVPVPNVLSDHESWLDAVNPDLVVLSGGNDLASVSDGPDVAPERDALERALIDRAVADGLPVLGVCRGMQMLVVHFGGHVEAVPNHAGTQHSITVALGDERPRTRTVASHHRWGVPLGGLPPSFGVVATAGDGTIEGIMHSAHPLFGMMWHPERGALHDEDVSFLRSLLAGVW